MLFVNLGMASFIAVGFIINPGIGAVFQVGGGCIRGGEGRDPDVERGGGFGGGWAGRGDGVGWGGVPRAHREGVLL